MQPSDHSVVPRSSLTETDFFAQTVEALRSIARGDYSKRFDTTPPAESIADEHSSPEPHRSGDPTRPLSGTGGRPSRPPHTGGENRPAAPAPGPVARLGLGPFRTGTEALHGLAWLGPATVFPQAIGLATTWDPELVRAVGSAVGDEVRGFHHKDPARAGLNVWAPVVNPLRDPRWGRNEEGYAEDPWLTGVIATAYAPRSARRPPPLPQDRADAQALPGLQQRDRPRTTSSNLAAPGAARLRAAGVPRPDRSRRRGRRHARRTTW